MFNCSRIVKKKHSFKQFNQNVRLNELDWIQCIKCNIKKILIKRFLGISLHFSFSKMMNGLFNEKIKEMLFFQNLKD